MPKLEYTACGKVINTHGYRGTVKLESWCDTPQVLSSLQIVYFEENGAYRPVRVRHASQFRQFVLADLEGIESMEHAQALKGTVLYAKREDLPIDEDAVLVAELIGLPVYDAQTKALLGRVRDVIHPGATDIYVIDTPNGEAMVPAVAAFVKEVDVENGIWLTPIEGMFP